MSRYPLPPFPFGWYQIGWSHRVRHGHVEPLTFFDRELVLFRDRGGRAAVLDAYCPHLGAHLGHGGTVGADGLACPFHGWTFDAAGQCTAVPGAAKVPPKACIRSWPLRENNGLILIWFHPDGAAPSFEIPDLAAMRSGRWSQWKTQYFDVECHIQDVAENAVDVAHFPTVHHWTNMSTLHFTTDGPVAVGEQEIRATLMGKTIESGMRIEFYGPGLRIVRAPAPLDAEYVVATTPISGERTWVFSGTATRKRRGRLDLPVRAWLHQSLRQQFVKDMVIWRHKRYRDRPLLSAADGPIMKFRKWNRQFDPTAAEGDGT